MTNLLAKKGDDHEQIGSNRNADVGYWTGNVRRGSVGASVSAAVTAGNQVELAIMIKAPDHVAVDANFVANIAYENAEP
jgi:hypothetical protein